MDVPETPLLTRDEQLAALTAQVMRDYSEGRLTWRQIRDDWNVDDFNLVLERLGDQGLKLPRAPADRPTKARGWLLDAIADMKAKAQQASERPAQPD